MQQGMCFGEMGCNGPGTLQLVVGEEDVLRWHDVHLLTSLRICVGGRTNMRGTGMRVGLCVANTLGTQAAMKNRDEELQCFFANFLEKNRYALENLNKQEGKSSVNE